MTHISDRYFRKHGHYPRVQVVSGIQTVTVEFCRGYVSIKTSSPYQAEIHITRRAYLQLLRKMIPLAKVWAKEPAKDHDVPAAMREAYWHEMQLLQERRAMKKGRSFDVDAEAARKRQHQRWLKAKARAARRQT
jgi:hypothetical protein